MLPEKIYVIISERDSPDPDHPQNTPIIHEHLCTPENTTFERAMERARHIGTRYGRAWIGEVKVLQEVLFEKAR